MALNRFQWRCPRAECKGKEPIYSYTEMSLDSLIRIHEMEHEFERVRNIRKFDEAKRTQEKPKDYNCLKITVIDIGFLKTRGVKIDDDMELESDGYGSQHSYDTTNRGGMPTGHLGKSVQPYRDNGDWPESRNP